VRFRWSGSVAELADLIERVAPPDEEARAAARRAYDAKTKPRGSLGRLEEIGCRIAAIRGGLPGRLDAAVVVAAGDHGVASEGISAYPQEVTAQMVANFVAGGAAINVLARAAGARLVLVDAGVATACGDELVRSLGLGAGTSSFVDGPAMTPEQAERALLAGAALAAELAADGIGLVGLGEMGIGNTTSAGALAAALLGVDPAAVCGRGTGLDDDGVARKVEVVRRGLERNPERAPLAVLASVGGFEIAFLAGLVLGCAAERVPVLLDGFITGAAALVAVRLAPVAAGGLIASHRSPEPGHALVLEALGLRPLVELDLRLGEGSGAALVLPLVQASLAVLEEMATFGEAGVTDAGR
jgi:nicotinate-nucleotide--dimethylbenzimidazole phosphoribosyltransferase